MSEGNEDESHLNLNEHDISNQSAGSKRKAENDLEIEADEGGKKKVESGDALEGHLADDQCVYNWVAYFDANSGKHYYFNLITKKTQWERPEGFKDPELPTSSRYSSVGFDSQDYLNKGNLEFKATFNKKTGSFSTSSEDTYWETKGRPTDREGRQMSAFFDLNSLEENRRKAQEIKTKLANSNIDWKKYQEEKKAKKNSKAKAWLLKDE